MRPSVLTWLLALAGAALILLFGVSSEDVYWNDFNAEAWPPFQRLIEGDLAGFLSTTPIAYGGSMIVRAPFAALAGALGFDAPGVFRLGAIPCVGAMAVLAVHLARRVADDRWRILVVALGAASPMALTAIEYGHPEELLATALATGAVLAALHDRAILAGALLGAAVASKQWAILAVLPTVLAAPRHRVRLLGTAGAAGAALLAPFVLADPAHFAAAQEGVASSARWFRPRQLWWPFGVPAPAGMNGPEGATVTPGWLIPLAKPLIVALAVPLSVLWLRTRRRAAHDALLLLALLMLLRCLLDPWNVVYYHLPLVTALLAWEVVGNRRIPLIALTTTALVWLTFETYQAAYSTGPWLAYLAWTLPLAAFMARQLYVPAATLSRPCAGQPSAALRSSPSTSTT